MSEWFKLKNKEFSESDNEWQRTYSCLLSFTFKKFSISEITITDHYQEKHPEITDKLILNILKERINDRKRMKPRKRHGTRDIYVLERTFYQDQRYRLVFWFKNGSDNHLWIRNCHPQD